MLRSSYVLRSVFVLVSALLGFAQAPAHAQSPSAVLAPTASVISRDAQDRPVIRAIHVPEGLQIDGRLEEPIYRDVTPTSEFFQMEPNPGEPATEKTEVWIAFDADNVYVSVRCWDSQPEERWVVDEMRRDNVNVVYNENIAIMFDTFLDRRNGVLLEMTPIGGIWDGLVTNEQPGGADWNPVWDRRAGRFEGGWTAEMAVPFKSLRYQPGTSQTWGLNVRRTIRWKNEESYLVKMPVIAGSSGLGAIHQVSNAATLVGIQAPSASNNIEIKPYALSSVATDRLARPALSNDPDGDFGVDVKYGLTQSLTADFTYNTDFAQVEVDTQQVNLTRFSLFFPEKREFFLEGQGIFEFGGAGSAGGTTPILFFSRRIGPQCRPRDSHRRGRPADRAHRTVHHRRDQRASGRRLRIGYACDELFRHPPEARHQAAQQRGPALHGTLAVHGCARFCPDVRRRRGASSPRVRHRECVSGKDEDAWTH